MLLALSALLVWRARAAGYVPDAPVIGILTYPSYSVNASCKHDCGSASRAGSTGSYYAASYVQWLEQAGARVVPIRYDLGRAELRATFRKVNGVLLTGGPGRPTDTPTYFRAATALYRMVEEAYRGGEVVPLWGTCLGIQSLVCIAGGGRDILGDFPLMNYAYPLEFTAFASNSRLFGELPEKLRRDFEGNVTTNWHSYGVSPERLAAHAPSLVPLATNVALNGEVFVSAVEGRNGLPVYGVQFHPESNQFNAGVKMNGMAVPSRSAEAIRAAQYLANFMVGQARRNAHAFPSELEESLALSQQAGWLEMDRVGTVADLYPEKSYHFSPARELLNLV